MQHVHVPLHMNSLAQPKMPMPDFKVVGAYILLVTIVNYHVLQLWSLVVQPCLCMACAVHCPGQ